MDERRFFLLPDGGEIQSLRAAKGWSVEQLAYEANIDVRTVESAEKRQRKRFQVLNAIASALGVAIEVIVPSLRKDSPASPSRSSICVFNTWDEARPIMESVKESILIIDSFFSEYAQLGLILQKEAKQRTVGLNVSVYMASPEKDFGAQRVREKGFPVDDENCTPKDALQEELTDAERDSYENTFHTFEAGIRHHISHHSPGVAVYEYTCMPSLRVIVVDDLHFFFGWFPLFDQNPEHVLFYLKGHGLEGADVELLGRLKAQIEKVKAVSIPALKKRERLRKNRRGDHRSAD